MGVCLGPKLPITKLKAFLLNEWVCTSWYDEKSLLVTMADITSLRECKTAIATVYCVSLPFNTCYAFGLIKLLAQSTCKMGWPRSFSSSMSSMRNSLGIGVIILSFPSKLPTMILSMGGSELSALAMQIDLLWNSSLEPTVVAHHS